ncbi:MAG TPA: propanediol utilization protein [Bacteroidales bacterium]|nr:MAG: propanediol utilization protein [Bacteroidetes bacterium GWF2_33_38]OFY76636.1 MAG: propanediol utilization protein [Bacteroidetes bacterium RIFOXYA12_FULL_33_9]OFY92394.1 MAG: propanediol utilization protein [Bacteroidetes bacterium RIFOXYA2_FULL_33_7]HBF88556.1 propanediol utilization protein [Bacteroidales bacterium]
MSLIVLGVLEFSSIAIGIKVLDEMVKTAPINIIEAKTMCPGKYLIVFSGDVASVEYSYNKGHEVGKNYLVDSLYLPLIHQDVVPAIGNIVESKEWNTIGIIETLSVVSAIEAADIAAKVGGVKIIEVRLAIGFGGKSYVKMMGSLDDVQAANSEAVERAKEKNQFLLDVVIPQPHNEIKPFFMK